MEAFVIDRIFKPKGSRIYRWRYRLRPEDAKISEISLGTSDKQAAVRIRTDKLRELEQERAGIIAPKTTRDAAQRKLEDHLQDFLGDLRRRGKSEKYLANLEFRVGRLITDCGWQFAKDVSADSFQAWLRKQEAMRDKTANDYLESVRCLFNWLLKLGRAGSNPLLLVEKVKTKEGRAEEIRALSDEEMRRLLTVAGERKVIYLMAVYTGLRSGELGALKWGDLHLDAVMPFVRVRANTTKNGKAVEMRLHPDLVAGLREHMGTRLEKEDLVFKKVPRIERFRRDLNKAKIPLTDSLGKKAVFHSLRHTMATNLQRAGVPSRVAMTVMRHSDRRLTDKIYTDESLLATADAIDALPGYGVGASPIASQKLGAEGQAVSAAIANVSLVKVLQRPVNIEQSRALAIAGAGGQLAGNGGSGGARTRNLCRDRAAL